MMRELPWDYRQKNNQAIVGASPSMLLEEYLAFFGKSR